MNPSHDNTQDSADLEIARLKAELAEINEDYTTLKTAIDLVSGALCDSGEVVPEDCREYGEAVRGIVEDRLTAAAEIDRLTEEKAMLVDALKRSTRVIRPSGSDRCLFCHGDLDGKHDAGCFVGAALPSGDSE